MKSKMASKVTAIETNHDSTTYLLHKDHIFLTRNAFLAKFSWSRNLHPKDGNFTLHEHKWTTTITSTNGIVQEKPEKSKPCEQVIEESSPGPADMKVPGGGRRKADADLAAHPLAEVLQGSRVQGGGEGEVPPARWEVEEEGRPEIGEGPRPQPWGGEEGSHGRSKGPPKGMMRSSTFRLIKLWRCR